MTLDDLLSKACSPVMITPSASGIKIFINNTLIQTSNEDMYSKIPILRYLSKNEVLCVTSFYNGVENVISVIV